MAKKAATKASDYLIQLSKDPKARAAHKQDPAAAMSAAGLSASAKKALSSGDPEKIRKHLGDDAPPGCMILLI
ncbi:MAG TPA: hypothetical protein VF017_06075 [Thermoanaerobaculia bacterium]|nr:hypothetical protein [Thermoanaerobaculia bacterium]